MEKSQGDAVVAEREGEPTGPGLSHLHNTQLLAACLVTFDTLSKAVFFICETG